MSASVLKRYVPALIVLVLCLPAWWIDARLAWAGYLAAWWFCVGVVMGGLVNVWIHTMTGGEWGEVIRSPLLALARAMPLLAVLFIPVLMGVSGLYPWMEGDHATRWAGELTKPEFKRIWLDAPFFVVRSVVYLIVWVALAAMTQRPRWNRSHVFAAAALLIYGVTGTLAAIDWIMSLVPRFFSTSFGLLVLVGQGLAGIAYGTLAAAAKSEAPRGVYRDLGNILLTYVLLWAYLAFTQYLIIWAENLPDEIAWYVPRVQTHWWWIGWLLITCHFFIPLLVLLSRFAKSLPFAIGMLAAALLFFHLIDVWWLTVPSVRPHSAHVLWFGPLAALGVMLLVSAYVRSASRV